jgi:hypothetical protein
MNARIPEKQRDATGPRSGAELRDALGSPAVQRLTSNAIVIRGEAPS